MDDDTVLAHIFGALKANGFLTMSSALLEATRLGFMAYDPATKHFVLTEAGRDFVRKAHEPDDQERMYR